MSQNKMCHVPICHNVTNIMDDIMVRKSKIEKSDHYEEIHEKLLTDTSRNVSDWLEETYGEKISYRTLERYKKNKIRMEERVEAEFNKLAEEESKEIVDDSEDIVEKNIEQKTKDTISEIVSKEKSTEDLSNTVAVTMANNMKGVAKVASELPSMFEKAKRDALDPDTNVTFKDVANICIQANKIFSDYFKDTEPDIEVNVNNDIISLSDSIEKSRQKYLQETEK